MSDGRMPRDNDVAEVNPATSSFVASATSLWRRLKQTGRLIVGVPDYDHYVSHMRTRHPDRPVMSYIEFFNDRQAARYKSGGGRCC